MRVLLANRKLLGYNTKLKKRFLNLKVRPIKKVRTVRTNNCAANRLEDFEPCGTTKNEKRKYCRIHDNIHALLVERSLYIDSQYNSDPSPELFQLKNFIDEHFNRIFPEEASEFPTECNILNQDIWLNKNDFIFALPGVCVALNLLNGNTICGKQIDRRDKYCMEHEKLKEMHAALYHFSYTLKHYQLYHKVYRNEHVSDVGEYYRNYIEFFIRLEHSTIYQITMDPGHFNWTKNLLRLMIGDKKRKLPESESFYRELYVKFCKPERYSKFIFCFLKIFITLSFTALGADNGLMNPPKFCKILKIIFVMVHVVNVIKFRES